MTSGGSKPKEKGTNFEHRVMNNIEKLEFIDIKRQAYSGASSYKEDASDVIGSLHFTEFMQYHFLFECKKKNQKSFQFATEWVPKNGKSAAKMTPPRIPVVAFAGMRTPIYIMLEKNVYYRIFGNYNKNIIRLYKTRGSGKYFSINWAKVGPLLKGQVNEKNKLKIVEFEVLDSLYMIELSEAVYHLKMIAELCEAQNF